MWSGTRERVLGGWPGGLSCNACIGLCLQVVITCYEPTEIARLRRIGLPVRAPRNPFVWLPFPPMPSGSIPTLRRESRGITSRQEIPAGPTGNAIRICDGNHGPARPSTIHEHDCHGPQLPSSEVISHATRRGDDRLTKTLGTVVPVLVRVAAVCILPGPHEHPVVHCVVRGKSIGAAFGGVEVALVYYRDLPASCVWSAGQVDRIIRAGIIIRVFAVDVIDGAVGDVVVALPGLRVEVRVGRKVVVVVGVDEVLHSWVGGRGWHHDHAGVGCGAGGGVDCAELGASDGAGDGGSGAAYL